MVLHTSLCSVVCVFSCKHYGHTHAGWILFCADALILNRAVTDALLVSGGIVSGSDTVIASSASAIAVKAGAPKPDISTPEALKRSLLAARAISYTDPAAGGASGDALCDAGGGLSRRLRSPLARAAPGLRPR